MKKKLTRFALQNMNAAGDKAVWITEYVDDVRNLKFPADEHTYKMVSGELPKLEELLNPADR